MKRVIIVLIVIAVLVIAGIYIFIPGQLVLSEVTLASANPAATNRVLIHKTNWLQQFGSKEAGNSSGISNAPFFSYKNDTFQILNKHESSLDILISASGSKINSSLRILPASPDTVALHWQASITTSSNPLQRVQEYNAAVRLKKDMSEILGQLAAFLQKQENLYGVNIEKTTTRDTFLIATKTVLQNYPTIEEIYKLVTMLNAQLTKSKAMQISPPMLNVTKADSNKYLVMVAVPTDIKIADEGNIFFRRMVPGSFLLTEVRGGPYSINQAMENVHLFISDYGKTSMAIPFQSLVTDRSKEPDTSKWITRIYYPVNY